MRRTISVLLAVAALAASNIVSSTARTDNAWEACFRSKTNYERTSRGIPALVDNPQIDDVARHHSDEMASQQTIYHNANYANEIPPYEYAGENVGMGPDCQTIQDAFMSSKPHRDNILYPKYQQVGIGVTQNGDTIYVTVDFLTPKSAARSKPVEPKCKS